MRVFDFNPREYADKYSRDGCVHIKNGVNPEFLAFAQKFTESALKNQEKTGLKEWRFANKKSQFLFEFPELTDLKLNVKDVIADVASLPKNKLTLCERHIKVYDDNAQANPPAHKDRVASEVTVGIPLVVPDNSYLILYPDSHRDVNPYSSTALYRSSLDEDQLPEITLKNIEPLKLFVWPGDVVLFKGSSIYHERVNPANTSLLYLKFNGMQLDPIGEDVNTPILRKTSEQKLQQLDNEKFLDCHIMVSPQLEKISRHYTRLNWQEVIQIYLWKQKEITINEFELRFIKSIDDGATIRKVLQKNNDPCDTKTLLAIKRLIHLGALNLL